MNEKLDTLRFKVYEMLEVFECIRLEVNYWDSELHFPVGKTYKINNYDDIEILIFDLNLNEYPEIEIEEEYDEAIIRIFCE